MQLDQAVLNSAQHNWIKNHNVSRFITRNNEREHTLNLLYIRRTGIIRIYLLCRRALAKADEPMEEGVASGVVAGSSLVVGEVVIERRVGELLGEQDLRPVGA